MRKTAGLLATLCLFALSGFGQSGQEASQAGEPAPFLTQAATGNRTPAVQSARLSPDFVAVHRERLVQLIGALNLEYPGLEQVASAWAAGDLTAACNALLDYYERSDRHPPVTPLEDADEASISNADDAAHGIFEFQNLRSEQALRPDGGLDWASTGPKDDKEWAWFLNRHFFFRDLAKAYEATGNSRYIDAVSGYLEDWVLSNPYPARLTFSAQWRALEVARRILDSWTVLFYEMNDALSPQARILLLSSLPEHADSLANYASFWGGNHLLTEQTALALIAVSWPEFRKSSDWLSEAVGRTRSEVFDQTYPDGAFKELTNHYQRVVLVNLQALVRILRFADIREPDLEQRVETMWSYFANVMRPNGAGPLNNAGDREYNRDWIADVWNEYGREDWLYIASAGREGSEPELPPTRYYPYAGQAIMRSGWGPDDQWAFFDVGPHGSAHQHNDRLHLSITLGQYDILTDSGRYIYRPGKWKDYFVGAKAHNMVLIDGQGPVHPPLTVDTPLPNHMRIADDYDFFGGTNRYPANLVTGQGGARHTRSVFYRRGQYWLVADHVELFGPHKLGIYWHFHPDVQVDRTDGGLLALANQTTGMRLIQEFGPALDWALVRGEVDPPLGWYSPDYNRRLEASVAVVQGQQTRPFTLVWLLWPSVDSAPPVSVENDGPQLRITIGSEARSDVILLNAADADLEDVRLDSSSDLR